jgi:eukaryotic-like serine/threonine-protein kinase
MTGDRHAAPLSVSGFRHNRAQFSPDGKWIAYTSDESGRNEIYLQSFPSGAMKWQVSSTGADSQSATDQAPYPDDVMRGG